jgi:UDP-glucose 4-epimerase
MKILITGGAGYIGSHTIIDLLDNSDSNIISVDAFFNSNVKTFDRIKEITGNTIDNTVLDLANKSKTDAFFNSNTDIDGIIHFAAFKAVGESQEHPIRYYQNNIQSLTNVLDNCQKHDINNFIFSSSCTVYGEPDQLPVDENSAIKLAASAYGKTKQMGEEIIKDFAASTPNFKAVLLRYFNPIGAHISGKNGELPSGTPNNLVPFITQSAIGKRGVIQVFGNDYPTRDGSCIRDYIHVTDVAHAHTLGLNRLFDKNNEKQVEVFNLGTGNGVTVLEVIDAFEKATDQKLKYKIAPRREGDIIAVYSDSKKAKELLNWTPKHTLKDAMLSAWKWEKNLNRLQNN